MAKDYKSECLTALAQYLDVDALAKSVSLTACYITGALDKDIDKAWNEALSSRQKGHQVALAIRGNRQTWRIMVNPQLLGFNGNFRNWEDAVALTVPMFAKVCKANGLV